MADKNLRLDSRFSMIGAFWSPETPDTIMKDTLVSDEREINFITAPEYERRISIGPGTFAPDSTTIPALHGFTQDGLFTLCQLVEQRGPGSINFVVGQAIKARSFRVQSCLGGMHINGINDKCLTSARYTFGGLSAWFPQAFDEKWDTDQILVTIPMEPRQIQDFCLLDSRVRISVKVVSELTSGKDAPSRLSRSIASIEVHSPNPESLAWYRRIGGRLENLFSLLTGGSVAMETLFVCRGDESGHLITKRTGSVRHFDLLQCVMCSPNQLAQAIVTWICLPSKFDSVESLALEVLRKSKLFIETEFLALAQALEGFHRATKNARVLSAKVREGIGPQLLPSFFSSWRERTMAKKVGEASGIEAARARFEDWRSGRSGRSPIPDELWCAAINAARQEGVNRTAQQLHLDAGKLKRLLVAADSWGRRAPRKPRFVELIAPAPASAPECLIEFESASGSKMRIHWKAAVPPDWANLLRAWWDTER